MDNYNGKYELIDFTKLKRYKISMRKSKVSCEQFIHDTYSSGISRFVEILPDILKGKDIKELLNLMYMAHRNKKQFMISMGAHVIKCGLSPLLIEMMKRGIIKHLALNSACAIHDFEIAHSGKTSEEVADGIIDGTFGMSIDTGKFINSSAIYALENKKGFGESIGEKMEIDGIEGRNRSIIYNCWKLNIPVTIHAAIGTDIVHPHPEFRGEAFGFASGIDFKIFTNSVSKLNNGAIYFNIGSAVILPEVFLKAITSVRNLGYNSFEFYTVNCDMKEQYRASVNVTGRPVLGGGRSFTFIGHHEIMIPLIFGALMEKIDLENKK